MKNLKRFAVILLCLALATALFACGEEENNLPTPDEVCEEHVDADKNGKCDICDVTLNAEDDPTKDPTTDDPTTNDPTTNDPTTNDPTTDDPTTDDPTKDPTTDDPTGDEGNTDGPTEDDPTSDAPATDAEKYLAAIEEAIKGANTVRISATVSLNKVSGPYPDEEVNEEKINGVIEAIISKTENGVNVKLTAKELLEDGTFGESEDAYIIGDKIYLYSGKGNEYYESDFSAMSAEMNASLSELFAGVALPELSEDDILMVKQAVIAIFESTFTLDDNGNLVFAVDAAPVIMEALDAFKAIDYEKQTLGETLNALIAMTGAEITIEDILTELATYGADTVQDCYNALTEILLENTGMTDAQIFAMAIEEAGGVDAMLEQLAPMLEMYGVPADEVKAAVEALTNDGIKAFLTADILALTVDQIVDMLMQSAMGTNESDPITLAYLVDMIKQSVLPTPLVEMIGEETVEWIKNTEVNKLAAELALVIGENLAFEGVKFSTGVDIKFPEFAYNYDYAKDDYIKYMVNNLIQVDVSFDLAIEETVVEIKLPEGVIIVEKGPTNNQVDLNGKYGLAQIVVENISSGEEKIYNLGDNYYGMTLSPNNISVTLKDGVGVMSYSFEQSVSTNITYEVEDGMFYMMCEDAVDLFNNGNPQHVFELFIDEIDGKTCFVLTAGDPYSIFSYYVIEQ